MVPAQLAPREQGASVAGGLKPLVSFEQRRYACACMVVRYSRLLRPVAGVGDMTSVRQRKGSRGKESQLPAEPHAQPTICCSDHPPESSSFLGEWTFIQPAAAPPPPGGVGSDIFSSPSSSSSSVSSSPHCVLCNTLRQGPSLQLQHGRIP